MFKLETYLVKILVHSLFLSNKLSLSLRTIGPFKALLIILTISVLIPTGCAVRRTLPPSQSDQSNNPTDIRPTSEPAEKDREDQKGRRAELQQRRWVDSVYALLNDTTRITQLFHFFPNVPPHLFDELQIGYSPQGHLKGINRGGVDAHR